jgi:hypothetical protein
MMVLTSSLMLRMSSVTSVSKSVRAMISSDSFMVAAAMSMVWPGCHWSRVSAAMETI